MSPRATWTSHPAWHQPWIGPVVAALLALATLHEPARASLTSITTDPASPTMCDPVGLIVSGTTPTPCYTITRAELSGPVALPTMGPIPTFEISVRLVLRETADPDSGACPAVIQPYRKVFDLKRLAFGTYQVKAVEYILAAGATEPGDSSVMDTIFTVRQGGYCLFTEPCFYGIGVQSYAPTPMTRLGPCAGAAPPGGTACAEVVIASGVAVGGVQAVVDVLSPGASVEPVPGDVVHAVSVEAVDDAAGFQVAWTTEGSRTRVLLYSAAGDSIPYGQRHVLRICYAIGANADPGSYPVRFSRVIAADPRGETIPLCGPFDDTSGFLCVTGPTCDLNGDDRSDIRDIIQVVNCAIAPPTEACAESVAVHADCNGDGSVDVSDVVCCVRRLLIADGSADFLAEDFAGEPTRLEWAGPVRWLEPLEGRAEVTITPGTQFGGVDFWFSAASSGARIRSIRLAPGSPYQLQSRVTGNGESARAVLLSMSDVSEPATVWVDLVPALPSSGGGVLELVGPQSATRQGRWMPSLVGAVTIPVPEVAAPVSPSLESAGPNPFREATEITYALPSSAETALRVYSASGRLVRVLVDRDMPAGIHRARWDGRDGSGRAVGSGIYFFRFSAGGVTRTSRVLLLR